jgi:hypothetical protein
MESVSNEMPKIVKSEPAKSKTFFDNASFFDAFSMGCCPMLLRVAPLWLGMMAGMERRGISLLPMTNYQSSTINYQLLTIN